jgi:hypothetical protein
MAVHNMQLLLWKKELRSMHCDWVVVCRRQVAEDSPPHVMCSATWRIMHGDLSIRRSEEVQMASSSSARRRHVSDWHCSQLSTTIVLLCMNAQSPWRQHWQKQTVPAVCGEFVDDENSVPLHHVAPSEDPSRAITRRARAADIPTVGKIDSFKDRLL